MILCIFILFFPLALVFMCIILSILDFIYAFFAFFVHISCNICVVIDYFMIIYWVVLGIYIKKSDMIWKNIDYLLHIAAFYLLKSF